MEAIIDYLIRASVYLIILGSAYFILFARQNAMAFNRFFILLTFVLSLGLATVGRIPVNLPQIQNETEATIFLPEIVVVGGEAMHKASTTMASLLSSSIVLAPILISMALLVLLLIRIAKLRRAIKESPGEKLEDIQLVYLSHNHSPFSFFKWIFIAKALRGSEHFSKVITHEKAHFRLRHSWDVMFMEIMKLLFWFHPMYFLLKKELQAQHEYEADKFTLQKYDRSDYQRALLDFSMGVDYLPVTNPFNVSTLKKRFIMMNKNANENKRSLWIRLLLVVPFVAAAFVIQSCDFNEQDMETKEDANELNIGEIVVVGEAPIFTVVETNPEYSGGTLALMEFLRTNLRYPTNAREENVQGTVYVSFVVEKDGGISNVKVLRGVHEGLDAEAMRVIKEMPKWIPGKQGGENVRVQFNLPIRFVLQ